MKKNHKTIIALISMISILLCYFAIAITAYSTTATKEDLGTSVYPFNSFQFTTQENPNADEIEKCFDFPVQSYRVDNNDKYGIGDYNTLGYRQHQNIKTYYIPIFKYNEPTNGRIWLYMPDSYAGVYMGTTLYPSQQYEYITGYIYAGGSPDDQIPYENKGTIYLEAVDTNGNTRPYIYYTENGYINNLPILHSSNGLSFEEILHYAFENNYCDQLTHDILYELWVNNSVGYQNTSGWNEPNDKLEFTYTMDASGSMNTFRKMYNTKLDRYTHGLTRGYGGQYSYRISLYAEDFYTKYAEDFRGVYLYPEVGWHGSIHVEYEGQYRYMHTDNLIDENGDAVNVLSVKSESYVAQENYYFNDESQTELARLTPVPSMIEGIEGIYNPDKTIFCWSYLRVNIRIIPDVREIQNIYTSDSMNLGIAVWYNTVPATFDSWYRQQAGDFFAPLPDIPNVTDSDFISWLSDTVGGFFNTSIFGNITLGQIIWFITGIGVFFALLKYFAGG